MNRQRTTLLAVCIGLFVLVSALIAYRRVQHNQTYFKVGSVPADIVNQLIPKDVPVGSIRPPAIRQGDPVRYGNATSIVSIIEYGDFQCEFCRALAPEINRVAASYGGRVRFVWRDFPIEEIHSDAMPAAIFARCAGQQGKFWDAYDALMYGPEPSDRAYRDIATRLNLEPNLLNACRKDPRVEAAIRRDLQEARADGIRSAPFLFVGTKAFEGFVDAETMDKAVLDSLSSL